MRAMQTEQEYEATGIDERKFFDGSCESQDSELQLK
jgi:hypothetical protein